MSDNLNIGFRKQGSLAAAVLLSLSVLVACSSAPTYTEQDVQLAAEQGQLEPMFDQVQASLDNARPGSDQALALTQLRDDIGKRLAQPPLERIDALLGKGKQSLLSIAELNELDTKVAAVRKYTPYARPELDAQALTLREQSEAEIAKLYVELETLNASDSGRRYAVLTQLALLDSGDQTTALQAQAAAELDNIYEAGVAAVENKQLPLAQGLLARVLIADPAYRDLLYYQELVATGLFEQQFWQAMVDGMPEEAYRVFEEFSQTGAFETHSDRIAPGAGELAQYFEMLGDKSRSQGNWVESYRGYRKASFIRLKLGLDVAPSAGKQAFTTEMVRRYQAASTAGNEAQALALLSVIGNIDPNHELLAATDSTYAQVLEQAALQLKFETFSGDYGPEITASIQRYLTEFEDGSVRVLEAESELPQTAGFVVTGSVSNVLVGDESNSRTELREVIVGLFLRSEPGSSAMARPPESRSQRDA